MQMLVSHIIKMRDDDKDEDALDSLRELIIGWVEILLISLRAIPFKNVPGADLIFNSQVAGGAAIKMWRGGGFEKDI